MSLLRALVAPLTRTVTYTRWLHLLIGSAAVAVAGLILGLEDVDGRRALWVFTAPLPFALLAAALVPSMRQAEGLQARLMLLPGPHARHPGGPGGPGAGDSGAGGSGAGAPGSRDAGGGGTEITAAPSASWRDRWRTALWLMLRIEAGAAVAVLSVTLPSLSLSLVNGALGGGAESGGTVPVPGSHWWYALLVPLPPAVLATVVIGAGAGVTAAAQQLLGPSAAERLAALEERNERLLERGRLARELHDSIGHALTAAVVQSGAARASGSAEFTDRALAAIEETSRDALEDLERVLRLLREGAPGPGAQPGLADLARLLDSARAAGATVRPQVSGELDALPGPVSREGYRIVQEALTNVLRHAGPVVVSLRIAAHGTALELEVRNALPEAAGTGRSGSGLRGIRERAAQLGGSAQTGPWDGGWRVYARLPLEQRRGAGRKADAETDTRAGRRTRTWWARARTGARG